MRRSATGLEKERIASDWGGVLGRMEVWGIWGYFGGIWGHLGVFRCFWWFFVVFDCFWLVLIGFVKTFCQNVLSKRFVNTGVK